MKVKHFFLALLAVVLVAIIGFVVYFGVELYKAIGKEGIEITDVGYYQNNTLSQLAGGKYAEDFFPKASLLNSDPIKFYYFDGRGKTGFFRKYFTSIVLECSATNAVAENDFASGHNESEFQMDHFTVKEVSVTPNTVKMIAKNEEANTIRYIIFYDEEGSFTDNGKLRDVVIILNTICDW